MAITPQSAHGALSLADAKALSGEVGHDIGAPLGPGFTLGGQPLYGVAEREYVESLRFPASIGVYERMGTDSAVTAVFQAVTQPIRAAQRAIDPAGARPEVAAQIAADVGLPLLTGPASDPNAREHVPGALRSADRFIFAEHLRVALLSLLYGFMPFEQVVRVEDTTTPDGTGGGLRVRLRKLAPRFPATLSGIETAADGGLVGVRQPPLTVAGNPGWLVSQPPATTAGGYSGPATSSLAGGVPGVGLIGPDDVLIGVNRLVMYSYDRRGAGWQGRSMFRHAYRPWLLKDEAWKKWATLIDRTSMGVPVYMGAPQESDAQLAKGQALVAGARSGMGAGIGIPNGADARFRGIEGSLPDIEGYMAALNAEIMDGALAQFQKLGSSKSGGNRALGTAFIDFFTLELQAIDDWFTQTFNEHVIEDLVDWNYGPGEPAPKLVTVQQVGFDDAAMAAAVVGLVTAGAITPDAALESWLRRTYNLPELDAATARPAGAGAAGGAAQVADGGAESTSVAAAGRRRPFADPHHGDDADGHVHATGRRPVTTVEAASGLDVAAMDDAWTAALTRLLTAWQAIRADQVDALAAQVESLATAGDLSGLGALDAGRGAGVDALVSAMTALATTAAAQAAAEVTGQGLDVTAVDAATLVASVQARASAVDALLASGLANAASRAALVQYAPGMSAAALAAAVRAHLDGLTDTYLHEQLGGALTAAQNSARVATFAQVADEMTYYGSELLDGATCTVCAGMDGHQYASLSEAEAQYPAGGNKDCLGGARCRGTVVAVAGEAAPST